MGGIVEKDVELCPSARVLYDAIMDVAENQDRDDLLFLAGAHRTVIRVLDGQGRSPLAKEARRKADDAFAACLRTCGDRLLGEPNEDAKSYTDKAKRCPSCGDPA